MRLFLWILFVAEILLISPITNRITRLAGGDNTIIKIELATKDQGTRIVSAWSSIKYQERPLLDEARYDTYWDFLFILTYVALIIVESKSFMLLEPVYWLNELLRMNFFFAVIAGLLDVLENIFILHNISSYTEPCSYISSLYPSALKFILSAWCVLIWIIAIGHQFIRLFTKKKTLPKKIAYLNSVIYTKEEIVKSRNMGKFDIVAYLKNNDNSIDDRVKDAILFTYGDNDPGPSEIADDRAIADLGFKDFDFERLTGRFNIIIDAVKPGAQELDSDAVSALADVQACIDAVNSAVK